jgi:hypothetical protein
MANPSTSISLEPVISQVIVPILIPAFGALVLGIVQVGLSFWSKWTGQTLALSQADQALLMAAVENEAGKIAAKLDASVFANMKIDVGSPMIAEAASSIIGADGANLQAAMKRMGVTPSLVSSMVAGAVGRMQAAAPAPVAVDAPPISK